MHFQRLNNRGNKTFAKHGSSVGSYLGCPSCNGCGYQYDALSKFQLSRGKKPMSAGPSRWNSVKYWRCDWKAATCRTLFENFATLQVKAIRESALQASEAYFLCSKFECCIEFSPYGPRIGNLGSWSSVFVGQFRACKFTYFKFSKLELKADLCKTVRPKVINLAPPEVWNPRQKIPADLKLDVLSNNNVRSL
ncbi:hypothetical protein RRG08_022005 [Elysia crispata]|uniref:Uncharacterized protein n=1 Tax=Elysia crispata TaxID=231223 RepID=A0AAE1A8I0_9GAST|nr:hypothetical protein RRG08_022005 [Elysia crispata]